MIEHAIGHFVRHVVFAEECAHYSSQILGCDVSGFEDLIAQSPHGH
jgi:hypothetical protein